MVTTEPGVPSVHVLGLGSKLYPSNMLRMLNTDLTRFISPAKNVWLVDARPRDIAKFKMAAIHPSFVYTIDLNVNNTESDHANAIFRQFQDAIFSRKHTDRKSVV